MRSYIPTTAHFAMLLTLSFASFACIFMPMPALAQILDVPETDAQADFELETLDVISTGRGATSQSVEVPIMRSAGIVIAGMDINFDYQIDRDELTRGIAAAFKAANVDGSKTLSLVELANWRERVFGSREAMPGNFSFDTDFNGRVTRTEFSEALEFEFTQKDEDEDGIVSFADLVLFKALPQRRRNPEADSRPDAPFGDAGGQRRRPQTPR